jgi:predicted DNA-binding transcriptional regulator AlpA
MDLKTLPAPSRTPSLDATRAFISDWVTKIEIARRLKIGPRNAAELVKAAYWPAAFELSPRVLRWRWSEIEAALAEHAPRRTERQEPPQLAAARAKRKAE